VASRRKIVPQNVIMPADRARSWKLGIGQTNQERKEQQRQDLLYRLHCDFDCCSCRCFSEVAKRFEMGKSNATNLATTIDSVRGDGARTWLLESFHQSNKHRDHCIDLECALGESLVVVDSWWWWLQHRAKRKIGSRIGITPSSQTHWGKISSRPGRSHILAFLLRCGMRYCALKGGNQ